MKRPFFAPPARTALAALITTCFAAHASGAHAEETADATPQMPAVIVTDSRSDLRDVLSPGVVSVVYPDDVKGEHKSLPELLDQIPGVYVRRVAGTGQYTTASIRGSAPSQVNIYIDGVPVNLSSETAADLSTLAMSNVERVEVYRGTTPARFSGAPLGGAINIVTKTPQGSSGSLSAGMRSYGGRQQSASASAPLAGGRLMVGLDKESSDGDFKYKDYTVQSLNRITHGDAALYGEPSSPGRQWLEVPGEWQATPFSDVPEKRKRMNNGFDKDNLLLKWQNRNLVAKWAYTEMERYMPSAVSSSTTYAGHQQDLPGANVAYHQRYRQQLRQSEGLFGWRDSFGALDLGLDLSLLDQDKQFRNLDATSSGLGIGRAWSDYRTRRYGAAGDLAYRAGEGGPLQHLFEIHVDRYRETLHADASLLTANSDFIRTFRRDMTRLQFQDTVTIPALGDLQLTPVGRFERLEGPTIGSRWSPTGGPSGDFGWKRTGGLSAKKNFGGWQLFASTGTYNRYPTFYEIYGDGINVVNGADSTGKAVPLQRETGRNTDVGFGWDGRLPYDLAGGFRLTYFERKAKDAITLYAVPLAAKYVNSGDTFNHGVELEGKLSWGRRADLQLAATWQDGRYLNGGWYYFGGTPASGRADGGKVRTLNTPDLVANARLDLHFLEGALTVYAEGKYTGRNYIDVETYERPLTTFDLGAHYKVAGGFTFSMGVIDLFDRGPRQRLGGRKNEHYYSWLNCPDPSDFFCYFDPGNQVNERYPLTQNVYYPQQGRTLYATLAWAF